ncbi:MAG: hypothetical protein CMI71_02890, partial [Candidatus Pelagibacter sp.]|nr:hypothetical protein [Candidatus Pelagibacter sp.]
KIYHGPYVYNFEEIYELFNKYKISEKVYDEEELSMKITMDLSQSNEINSKEIGTINSLGKKILEDISNELDQIIN